MNTLKHTPAEQVPGPWYKEPWLWFVLTPIITVVLVSAVTVTIAISGADEVVGGPYQKKGRMIHLEPESPPAKDDGQ